MIAYRIDGCLTKISGITAVSIKNKIIIVPDGRQQITAHDQRQTAIKKDKFITVTSQIIVPTDGSSSNKYMDLEKCGLMADQDSCKVSAIITAVTRKSKKGIAHCRPLGKRNKLLITKIAAINFMIETLYSWALCIKGLTILMENKLMPFQEIYPTFHTFIGFRINKSSKYSKDPTRD